MQNETLTPDGMARPDVTLDVTRGVVRLFVDMGLSPLLEFTLPNGRRADVIGLDRKGLLICAEVKSCREDFLIDSKWGEYVDYCDAFYFATPQSFPHELLPESEGLIIADGFGGAVVRPAENRPIAPARRKSLTLKFARKAAFRSINPAAPSEV